MKEKIKKYKVMIVGIMCLLGCVFGIIGGVLLFAYLTSYLSVVLSLFVACGWLGLSISLLVFFRYYFAVKILNESISFLDKANRNAADKLELLTKYIYGHHKSVDESVPFYHKVAEQSYPLANVLGSFALSTKVTDTIILARWEHDDNACFYHIGGSPIHEEQLIYILDQIKYHSLKDVSENGMVWKKEELDH